MEISEAAYIAGLLDGEGCIRIQRFPTAHSPIGFQYRPSVELVMCDKLTMEWIGRVTGRAIRSRKIKSGRIAYLAVWYNSHAANLLREILPYMLGKREQAEIVLHFNDHVAPGRGKTYTQEHRVICDETFERLKALKRPPVPLAADYPIPPTFQAVA